MNIAGLQKMTLLDFPGRVACTVFLGGCNFICPYCHNSELLESDCPSLMTDGELLAFLAKRRGLLEGVCITGGEPTLHPDLPNLLRAVKDLGYAIKLDTNGTRPALLRHLVEDGLVDYVAMDVKSSPGGYPAAAGLDLICLDDLEESLRFLLEGHVDYELRTTVVAQLHNEQSIREMAQWLSGLVPGKKAAKFFLQPFVDRDTVPFEGLSAPETDVLEGWIALLSPCAEQVHLRGV